MAILNWKTSNIEREIIDRIAVRATLMAKRSGLDYPEVAAMMDVIACHANAYRLRLEELAAAPDFDFAHDVFGINRHLDRETGILQNCFVPRFAAEQIWRDRI